MAFVNARVKKCAEQAVTVLSTQFIVTAVYLFGSQAEGNANRWSDIDLAVFVEGLESLDLRERTLAMVRVQKKAGDDVEVHFFPAQALLKPESASFVSFILAKGIKLQ